MLVALNRANDLLKEYHYYFVIVALKILFSLATEGEDFSPIGDFQIVFESTVASVSVTQCAQVNLTADNTVEGEEEFFVIVSKVTPSFVTFNSDGTASVVIVDSDSKFTPQITCILNYITQHLAETKRRFMGFHGTPLSVTANLAGLLAVDSS